MDRFVRIKPPIIAGVLLLISFGLHLLVQGEAKSLSSFRFPGIFILAVGFWIMSWAFRLFLKKETPVLPTDKPTIVVSDGPFRFSRNPMYTGITLILLGIACLVGTFPMFLAPVSFLLIINRIFIPYEERKMEDLFGQTYLDYKRRVRRWL